MITNEQLDDSFKSASVVVLKARGFDTLVIRKGFEDESSLMDDEKNQILSYLRERVSRSDPLFIKAKDCIDQSEMSSDYFHNYPRKFRGAYYSVTLKFIASLMVNSLVRNINSPCSSSQVIH
ncbi:hypothetical protein SAMN03159341_14120 [Paenibacillus sp. 1_12]|uniref:hypothetical protein n=1 Tax=Paenibacillus sp. 1_12 TaxID=1566278 RepID=UPI0008F2E9B3|nr:hypothetical protein [Paenibacillus sp. 1_12]SFM51671.1 hypothetical protein SAMN03159341_14120 [Paenibacillus sp. 1_12]